MSVMIPAHVSRSFLGLLVKSMLLHWQRELWTRKQELKLFPGAAPEQLCCLLGCSSAALAPQAAALLVPAVCARRRVSAVKQSMDCPALPGSGSGKHALSLHLTSTGDNLSPAPHQRVHLLCSHQGCFFPEHSKQSLAFLSHAGLEQSFLCEPPRQCDLFLACYRQGSIQMNVPVKYVWIWLTMTSYLSRFYSFLLICGCLLLNREL